MLPRSKTVIRPIVVLVAIALAVTPIAARAAEDPDPSPSPTEEPVKPPDTPSSPSPPAGPEPKTPPPSGSSPGAPPGERSSPSGGGGTPGSSEAPSPPAIWWTIGYRTPGSYDTDALTATIAELEKLGVPAEVRRGAYAPFVVAGRATWTDTWGDIRHADEDALRPHLGQDVFCEEGTPILAAVAGTVSFGTDTLGGVVARVHDGGGYWYYAHLSSWKKDLAPGDEVAPGDVIGYCGKTGNASGTPPHVHFSRYSGGAASNPMDSLISWLREAEAGAKSLLAAARDGSSRLSMAERMLGDAFAPDLTAPPCAPELLSDPDYPWELSCPEAEDLGGAEDLVGFFLALSPPL